MNSVFCFSSMPGSGSMFEKFVFAEIPLVEVL